MLNQQHHLHLITLVKVMKMKRPGLGQDLQQHAIVLDPFLSEGTFNK